MDEEMVLQLPIAHGVDDAMIDVVWKKFVDKIESKRGKGVISDKQTTKKRCS